MSVYERNGDWLYNFQVGGRRFSASTGESSRNKAVAVEKKLKAEKKAELKARMAIQAITGAIQVTAPKGRPSVPVTAAADRYFNERVVGKPGADHTDSQLQTLVLFFGPETPLEGVGSERIAAFATWRKIQKNKNHTDQSMAPPVSPATVNREIELLRRVLRRAHKTWKVATAIDDIEWSDLKLEEPEERKRELTAMEEVSLVPVLRRLRTELVAPFFFAMITGMRQAAIINLTWHQVDFPNAVVRIQLKSRKPGGRVLTIPLTNAAMAILRAVEGQHETHVFTYGCRLKRGPRAKGARYKFTKAGLDKMWRAAMGSSGVVNFKWHDLRHTAATRLLRVTGNLALVKELLGHKDIASTMRYAHANVEDVRRGLEAVEGVYFEKSQQNRDSLDGQPAMPLIQKA